MYIGQIHLVTDLTDGQRVYPDADHSYQIQSEDDPSLDTTVQYVERRGDRLIARGHTGQDDSELAPALTRSDFATTPHGCDVWAFSRWRASLPQEPKRCDRCQTVAFVWLENILEDSETLLSTSA